MTSLSRMAVGTTAPTLATKLDLKLERDAAKLEIARLADAMENELEAKAAELLTARKAQLEAIAAGLVDDIGTALRDIVDQLDAQVARQARQARLRAKLVPGVPVDATHIPPSDPDRPDERPIALLMEAVPISPDRAPRMWAVVECTQQVWRNADWRDVVGGGTIR